VGLGGTVKATADPVAGPLEQAPVNAANAMQYKILRDWPRMAQVSVSRVEPALFLVIANGNPPSPCPQAELQVGQ